MSDSNRIGSRRCISVRSSNRKSIISISWSEVEAEIVVVLVGVVVAKMVVVLERVVVVGEVVVV